MEWCLFTGTLEELRNCVRPTRRDGGTPVVRLQEGYDALAGANLVTIREVIGLQTDDRSVDKWRTYAKWLSSLTERPSLSCKEEGQLNMSVLENIIHSLGLAHGEAFPAVNRLILNSDQRPANERVETFISMPSSSQVTYLHLHLCDSRSPHLCTIPPLPSLRRLYIALRDPEVHAGNRLDDLATALTGMNEKFPQLASLKVPRTFMTCAVISAIGGACALMHLEITPSSYEYNEFFEQHAVFMDNVHRVLGSSGSDLLFKDLKSLKLSMLETDDWNGLLIFGKRLHSLHLKIHSRRGPAHKPNWTTFASP